MFRLMAWKANATPRKRKKEKFIYLSLKSDKVGALFSSLLKSLNLVSLRLNLGVFKAKSHSD